MNASRYLFAIPVLFAASITAAACSSSSSPATGVGDGGGTSNPDCATLLVCCESPSFPAAQKADCVSIANAGGAACTTNLSTVTKAGACTTTGTSSSSSVTSSSSTSSSVASTGTGTGTSSTAGPTCTPTLAAGWAPETITLPPTTSCTTATATSLADDCFNATDAGSQTACNTDIQTSCGECMVTLTSASVWGDILLIPEGSGSTGFEVEYPFFFPGNCIAKADPTNGAACNTAFSNLVQCELASCTAQCPVASSMDTAGQDAFVGTFDTTTGELTAPGCIQNADNTTCMTYATAFSAKCGADEADGSATGVFAQCEGATVSALTLIEDECGGGT